MYTVETWRARIARVVVAVFYSAVIVDISAWRLWTGLSAPSSVSPPGDPLQAGRLCPERGESWQPATASFNNLQGDAPTCHARRTRCTENTTANLSYSTPPLRPVPSAQRPVSTGFVPLQVMTLMSWTWRTFALMTFLRTFYLLFFLSCVIFYTKLMGFLLRDDIVVIMQKDVDNQMVDSMYAFYAFIKQLYSPIIGSR